MVNLLNILLLPSFNSKKKKSKGLWKQPKHPRKYKSHSTIVNPHIFKSDVIPYYYKPKSVVEEEFPLFRQEKIDKIKKEMKKEIYDLLELSTNSILLYGNPAFYRDSIKPIEDQANRWIEAPHNLTEGKSILSNLKDTKKQLKSRTTLNLPEKFEELKSTLWLYPKYQARLDDIKRNNILKINHAGLNKYQIRELLLDLYRKIDSIRNELRWRRDEMKRLGDYSETKRLDSAVRKLSSLLSKLNRAIGSETFIY